MHEDDRSRLSAALSRYYAEAREPASPETLSSLAEAMTAEDTRMQRLRRRRVGTAKFVAAQVRYIPAWTWALQVSLVMLMFAIATATGSPEASQPIIGGLSALAVLVGVPTVQASKLHRVAELEYACPKNAASVLLARLIILGCSSSLTVAAMLAAVSFSLDISAFTVALWSCPPFFLSCAISLTVLRKAAPDIALSLCAVWAISCSLGLAAAANILPNMYDYASLVVWAGAASVALGWLIHEVASIFHAVAAGLEAFCPHMTKVVN